MRTKRPRAGPVNEQPTRNCWLLLALARTACSRSLPQLPVPAPAGRMAAAPAFFGGPRHVAGGPVQHLADGHPDMQGFWNAANNGGAVFELQNHPTGRPPFFGPGKGAIVDPADGFIPYQPGPQPRPRTHLKTIWPTSRSCTATNRACRSRCTCSLDFRSSSRRTTSC